MPNLGPDLGPVCLGSGLDRGSEPDYGNPIYMRHIPDVKDLAPIKPSKRGFLEIATNTLFRSLQSLSSELVLVGHYFVWHVRVLSRLVGSSLGRTV